MGMRKTILTLDFNLQEKVVSILKKNFSHYIPIGVSETGKQIYARPERFTSLTQKALRGTKKPRHRRLTQTREISGRVYTEFRFPLYRRNLVDVEDVLRLMQRIKVQYKSIQQEQKNLSTQRVAVDIGAAERLIIQGKKSPKETEYTQTVSTSYYERDEEATKIMFDALQASLLKFILEDDYSDLTQLQEEKRYAAVAFYVIFEQDRR